MTHLLKMLIYGEEEVKMPEFDTALYSEYRNKWYEYEPLFHISGILDSEYAISEREAGLRRIKTNISDRIITNDSDAFNEIKRVNGEMNPNHNLAILKPNARINLLYPKEQYERAGIDQPNWVAKGANWLATKKGLTFGLFEERGFTEERYNELQEELIEEAGLPRGEPLKYFSPFSGYAQTPPSSKKGIKEAQKFKDRWRSQVLDDLMKGNAENMFRQLIPRSGGKKGYYIGLFFIPPLGSPETAVLAGGMRNPDGSMHVISDEELIGASLSEHLLEYVQSWYFDYNHENIIKLYEEGRKEGGTEGFGWWHERGGFFEEKHRMGEPSGTDDTGDWMMDNLRRTIHLLFQRTGETEFKYAVKPLYDMMQAKAVELKKDLLDEEEAQDVLREYMDRHRRHYSMMLRDEPYSHLTDTVRAISNFYELDLNPREMF